MLYFRLSTFEKVEKCFGLIISYNKTTLTRGKPIVTNLNVDSALLQEDLELEREIAIETLVEIALREYIQRRKQPQPLKLSFGESQACIS
jgi:hypothetical protein